MGRRRLVVRFVLVVRMMRLELGVRGGGGLAGGERRWRLDGARGGGELSSRSGAM